MDSFTPKKLNKVSDMEPLIKKSNATNPGMIELKKYIEKMRCIVKK
jgi:hypothetical protein